MSATGWVGFDLDGTLAHYDGWNDGEIGCPIEPMVGLLRDLVASGTEVRILTARVCSMAGTEGAYEQRTKIREWLTEHVGFTLPIQAEKDFDMLLLYDDRALGVVRNKGVILNSVRGANDAD